MENLELIPTFFSIKKIPSFYLKNGISEIEYYKYHLESHYIKITSIIDFISNFINEVYRLGIPNKKCNTYTVLENLNVKDIATYNTLKEFELHFRNLKTKRNIIIHQGKLEIEEIKTIDSNILDKKFLGDKKKLIDHFNKKKQIEVEKVVQGIVQNNDYVVDFIFDIIETLKEPFLNNYNFLKSLEQPKN